MRSKSLILFLTSALTLGLGACGGNKPSSSSTDPEPQPEPEPAPDWTEEQKADMAKALNGDILPYVEDFEFSTEFVALENVFVVRSNANTIGRDAVTKYVQLLETADFQIEDFGVRGLTYLERTVTVGEQERVDCVALYLANARDDVLYHENTGYFYLAAGSLLNYDWPEEQLATYLDFMAPGTETVIPAFEGETSGFEFDDSYLYSDIQGLILVANDVSEDDAAAYMESFVEAGWEFASDEGISPNGDFYVFLMYDESAQTARLGIQLAETMFPIPFIYYVLNSVVSYSDVREIPAFDSGEVEVYYDLNDYINDYGVGVIYVSGVVDEEPVNGEMVATYATILEDAGWTVEDSEDTGGKVAYSEDGFVQLDVYFDSDYSDIAIVISPAPINEWPAEYVAELLDMVGGFADELPAPEGDLTVSYIGESSYSLLQVVVVLDESSDPQGDYVAVLEEAGFVYLGDDSYGDPLYLSPNGEYVVGPWLEDEYLVIDIYEAPHYDWPTNAVDDALYALLGFDYQDVLPAYEDGEEYVVDPYGATLYIDITLAEDADLEEAQDAYAIILEDAGFEYSDIVKGYVSPNCEYYVALTEYDGAFELVIKAYNLLSEFPSEAAAAWFANTEAPDFVLPVIEGDVYELVAVSNPDFCLGIRIYGAEATYYLPLLEEVGFVDSDGNPHSLYGYECFSEEYGDDLEIDVVPGDGYMTIYCYNWAA